MSRFASLAVVVGLALPFVGMARAADAPSPMEIIDKAIKARGGEEALKKVQGLTWKEKGTFYGMGAGVPYSGTYASFGNSKFKMEIENVFTIVVDGDKGWIKMADNADELPKEQLESQREALYNRSLMQLLPLKEDGIKLEAIGEAKVNDKPALGIKVSSKGKKDVTLYFDKDTNLLVKSESMVKDDQGGGDIKQETFPSEYKEVGGIKVPTKVVMKRDGKDYIEAEDTEHKVIEKLDDKMFGKP